MGRVRPRVAAAEAPSPWWARLSELAKRRPCQRARRRRRQSQLAKRSRPWRHNRRQGRYGYHSNRHPRRNTRGRLSPMHELPAHGWHAPARRLPLSQHAARCRAALPHTAAMRPVTWRPTSATPTRSWPEGNESEQSGAARKSSAEHISGCRHLNIEAASIGRLRAC
jgi:hypothetical protein